MNASSLRPLPGLLLCLALGAGTLGASRPATADQAALHLAIGDPARRDREVPLVLDGITDTAAGGLLDPEELPARLRDVGLLFIGESHTDLQFHNVQLRVIQELHRSGREVLVGLEMFPWTQQASLDGWIGGDYTEKGFVDLAGWYTYWGYNWEYYRDIFLYARENGIHMYGVNTPRDIVTAVRKKGFKDLTPEEARSIPHEVKPATEDQRRMYRAFFDPADALHMNEEAMEGMLRAQTTWDATMGWNALSALKEHGGKDAIMVVMIGSGHVTYGLGAERQVAPYYDGKVASLIPVVVKDDAGQPVSTVRASYANFVWGLPRPADDVYPALGVSLMGSLGEKPNQIIQVSKDSVASRSGLAVGDILEAIDGRPVDSGETLRKIVSRLRWGDVVTARVVRDGKATEVTVPFRRAAD